MGDYQRAVADYSAAIDSEPRNSFAYYNRGITRDRLGDFAGAIEDFSAAIALDPSNADFYHNRGFSYRKEVCVGWVWVSTRVSRAHDGS
jgi:tetratricopeptide (TPR) repeat protein